jgi:hypothetical protein
MIDSPRWTCAVCRPVYRHAGFADGSVRALREGVIDEKTLKALATIDGGEAIDQGLC